MITPEPPAGSEHYREGWRHGYEQAAIDRERSADAVRLVPATLNSELQVGAVPDTGQADEVLKLRWEVQQLQGVVQDQRRAIAAVRSLCADAMKLPTREDPRPADDRVSPRAVLAALDRAGSGPDTGQARADVDALKLAARRFYVAARLLDQDSAQTEYLDRLSEAFEQSLPTSRLELAAKLLTAPATSPSRDTVPAPADNDPYCILPTRTEHIPALLARLDELEGTR